MERITFAFVASFTVIIPVILGAIKFGRLNQCMRWAYFYLIVALVFQVTGSTMYTYGQNNLPLFHLYSVVRFGFLSYIFFHLLSDRFIKRVILANILFFLLFSCFNVFFIQSMFEFNTNTLTIEGILLIIYSVFFLLQILSQMKVKFVERYHGFWLVSGILYYFAGNFFLFNLSNILIEDDAYRFSDYWHIHSVNLVLFYTAFSVAILQKSGHKKMLEASNQSISASISS